MLLLSICRHLLSLDVSLPCYFRNHSMMYSRIKFICVNVFFIMKTNQESWKIVQFVRSTLNKKVIKKIKLVPTLSLVFHLSWKWCLLWIFEFPFLSLWIFEFWLPVVGDSLGNQQHNRTYTLIRPWPLPDQTRLSGLYFYQYINTTK